MEPANTTDSSFTSSISDSDLLTLCMMGFPKEYVHIAYQYTKEKNLQAVSDWLLGNQDKIEAMIQKEKQKEKELLARKESQEEEQKDAEKSIKFLDNIFDGPDTVEKNKDSKNKPQSKKEASKGKKGGAISDFLSNQKVSKKSKENNFAVLNDGNDDNSDENNGNDEEEKVDTEVKSKLSHEATYRLLDISKEIMGFEFQTVLDIIKLIYDVVTKIKHAKEKYNQEIIDALSNRDITDGLVGSVRRNLFIKFNLLFKQKIDRSHRAFILDLISDFSMIETSLLSVMELKIFSREQYQTLKTGYNNFCKKVKIRQKKEITDFYIEPDKKSFRRVYGEKQENKQSGSNNVDSEGEVPGKMDEEQTNTSDQKAADETSEKKSSKSFCVICKIRTKEIVFLPCAHFLSCAHCSPDYANCPACSGYIDQKLRIYWS